MNIDIYFRPDKKWWQVWKKSRYLIKEKDFIVEDRGVKLLKNLKGSFTYTYECEND